MKLLDKIKDALARWKAKRAKKKRMKEMRKRDPFIY